MLVSVINTQHMFINRHYWINDMRKIALALMAFLCATPSFASVTTIQKNVTVPGSGTPFDFGNDGTNSWPLMQLWDGTNLGVVNPNGQATVGNSAPVVLPAVQVTQSPCGLQKSTTVTLTSSNTASTQLIALAALNTIYICSVLIKPTAATVFNLIEGVGTNCTGGSPAPQAVVGSTTAANGVPLAALGDGFALASSTGVWTTHAPGDALCFTQTVAEALSITLSYVQTQL